MRIIPDKMVKNRRNSEISPKPNVYVGLKVFMWVFTPWIWRKKLFLMTAALDLSDVGLPVLRKEARKEFLTVFRFSLSLPTPDWFNSFMVFLEKIKL
jgi:hypothetical protein